ncbi:response regulator [Salinarimonas soli]|nr:response regulator [Salinarimonas soli]
MSANAMADEADAPPAGDVSEARPQTRFRGFELVMGSRVLLRDGVPVEIGSRAFDLLAVLLLARGTIVTKDEIFRNVWPRMVVEESNLRFQMACLRKVLGPDRDVIKTVPGRGYLLADEAAPAETRRPFPGGMPLLALPDVAPARATPAERPVPMAHPSAGEAPEVVLIEDDPDSRDSLQSLLRSAGLSVAPFGSVRAFLEGASPAPPRCVILDVWLPERSGLEFQADLIRAGLQVPLIFISGHADVHMSVRAMKAGALEFLVKPVRHQELLDAVRSAIAAPAGGAWDLERLSV